jgi:hypothetical protein
MYEKPQRHEDTEKNTENFLSWRWMTARCRGIASRRVPLRHPIDSLCDALCALCVSVVQTDPESYSVSTFRWFI